MCVSAWSTRLSPFQHGSLILGGVESGVDPVHDPAEQPAVQSLGNTIPAIHGLLDSVGTDNGLPCTLEQAKPLQ